jgi:Putative auto-transporter adhesin, head GIN domain
MKKLFLSLLLMTAVYNLLAQTTISDPNVEKRTVGSYHGIDVATGIQLILTAGNTEEVAVSASKTEYRDKIITRVENGVLKLYYETKTGAINKKNENKQLKAYVSYKTLDRLDVTTGAQVKINGVLTTTSLNLKSNTGGEVNGEINITTLKVKQNTGSKITLSGKSETLDVDGDTGSKFFGEGLRTVNCTASAGTGAQVMITVEKELNAKADTGGNIKYKGSASIRNVKTHTGGSISKI